MIDLTTKFMNLTLKNPIIVGSCGLTDSVESIIELEKNGAGAVVLKSLFEEQIMLEIKAALGDYTSTHGHAETDYYVRYFEETRIIGDYLKLIRDVKKAVSIPVIASINCKSADEWINFAKQIQEAGADGIQINLYVLPSDPHNEENLYEKTVFDIVRNIKGQISIPFCLKLGYYSDKLANVLLRVSRSDVAGLVLFNRSFNPDIDIEQEEISSGFAYSTPNEIANTLRWVAIASEFVECDLVAATGIHDGEGIIKQILAGANAVQMVSSIYINSPSVIKKSLKELEEWMKKHNYNSIEDFRGKLSKAEIKDPAFYERVQFLKYM